MATRLLDSMSFGGGLFSRRFCIFSHPVVVVWLYRRGGWCSKRKNGANGKLMALERWLSGRKHIPAKDAYPYRYRGFKSHSFRFFARRLGSPPKYSYYRGKYFNIGSGLWFPSSLRLMLFVLMVRLPYRLNTKYFLTSIFSDTYPPGLRFPIPRWENRIAQNLFGKSFSW